MPELPEVETVRQGLVPVMQGLKFERVVLNRPNLRFPFPDQFIARLKDKALIRLDRRAKFLIGELSSGERLIMHLGMSGRFIIGAARGKAKPKHDHVIFMMQGDGPDIIYNDPRRFGFMELLGENESSRMDDLGPEPLSNSFNGPALHARLMGKKSPIKSALLDQRIVAGLGNIYVCEALFQSGISPLRLCRTLTMGESDQLAGHIKDVLYRAIEAGGSSLKDFAKPDGALGYFQHDFLVYDKQGAPCPTQSCDGKILRIVQSGRSSFYCSTCQN